MKVEINLIVLYCIVLLLQGYFYPKNMALGQVVTDIVGHVDAVCLIE